MKVIHSIARLVRPAARPGRTADAGGAFWNVLFICAFVGGGMTGWTAPFQTPFRYTLAKLEVRDLRILEQAPDGTWVSLEVDYAYDGMGGGMAEIRPVMARADGERVSGWFEKEVVKVVAGTNSVSIRMSFDGGSRKAPPTLTTDLVKVWAFHERTGAALAARAFPLVIHWRRPGNSGEGVPVTKTGEREPAPANEASSARSEQVPPLPPRETFPEFAGQARALSPIAGTPGTPDVQAAVPANSVAVAATRHSRSNLSDPVRIPPPTLPSLPESDNPFPSQRSSEALADPVGLAPLVRQAYAGTGEAAAGPLSATAPPVDAEWLNRLTLGAGDLLSIALFGEPELTRPEVVVGPDGRLSYLEAQDVLAAGLTIDELRAALEQELAKFRRAPRTMITPVAFRSKKYFMLGKVVRRGVYTLERPLTVVEAVARAQGLETGFRGGRTVELVDFSRSFLARGGQRLPVDFERLFLEGDLSQNALLAPDDYLYFPPADMKEVYVLGEVSSPGVLTHTPDATALRAIASRGGFTGKAWRQKVLVIRGSLNEPQTFIVNVTDVLSARSGDFALQPRDIVFVSHRPWIKAEELLDAAASAFVQGAVIVWTGGNVGPILR